MLRISLLAAGFALAAVSSAAAQSVTAVPSPSGGTAGQNVVTPPVESIVSGNTGPSGAANVVAPPAESLTPGPNQTVLPPVEALVPGAPGGFPAQTGTGTTPTGTGTTTTGTGTVLTTLSTNVAAGLTYPPVISSAQAMQYALGTGGLAPIVTETAIAPSATQQVAFYGDREGARRGVAAAALRAMLQVPVGTSPGSRPGAPQYIGAPITPYDPDVPDALDFSRTP